MAQIRHSKFVIAIERADGGKVLLRPGSTRERELVATISARVAEKNVGILRTRAQVQAAVAQAVEEVLLELKSEVVPG